MCFELEWPINWLADKDEETEANDADEAVVADATNDAHVAKEAYEANKADEAKANETDEAIVADEATETDEAYLANKADMVMRPTRPMWHSNKADEAEAVNEA